MLQVMLPRFHLYFSETHNETEIYVDVDFIIKFNYRTSSWTGNVWETVYEYVIKRHETNTIWIISKILYWSQGHQ
jgi:hypothetical protein